MVMPGSSPTIQVGGNVEGSIVIGDNNFVVNNNHGTIVYKEAQPQVRLRSMAPKPPRAPRTFLGREREIAALTTLITDRVPVILNGTEGIGKSYLLKRVANEQAAQAFPNGVVFLEGIDPSGTALAWDDLQQLLFDALFESDPPLKVTFASARTYLSNTSPLVLLDNLQISSEALDSLADLFPQAPILAVPSRGIDSEVFEPFKLDLLPMPEAIELLAARAKIDLDEASRTDLEKACSLLSRFPLALATVGNVIRENELQLTQAIPALEAIVPAAVQPVKAAAERSLRFADTFLSADERQMMALAAAAPAVSTSREWLENTAGGSPASQRLENLGLLQANSPRLRLHAEYASLVLENVDPDEIRNRLLASLLEILHTRSLDFSFVKEELGNILGLMRWAAGQQRWRDVIALGRAVDPFLTLRGLWSAWLETLELVRAAAAGLNERAIEAWALHQLGTRQIGMGDMEQAVSLLRQALEQRKLLGDREGAAYTRHNLNLLGYSDDGDQRGPKNFPPVTQPDSLEGMTLALAGVSATPVTEKKRFSRRKAVLIALLLLISSIAALGGLVVTGVVKLPPGWNLPGFQPQIPATLVAQPASSTPTQAPSITPTASTTPTQTSSPSPTASPTPTASRTPRPSSTLTPTPSLTPTVTIFVTPTETAFNFPTFTVSVNQANCRYGPSSSYLYANGLYSGDTGEIRGRNFASTWFLVRLDKDGTWCWAASNTIQVVGDPASVNVAQPNLPHTTDTSIPTNVTTVRNGPQVTISWDQVHINLEDARGYLLDVTICQNTLRIQYIIQTDATSYTFTDETNCSKPSNGKIYAVNVRGYTDPVTIPWP